jgi:hypothetical protein
MTGSTAAGGVGAGLGLLHRIHSTRGSSAEAAVPQPRVRKPAAAARWTIARIGS